MKIKNNANDQQTVKTHHATRHTGLVYGVYGIWCSRFQALAGNILVGIGSNNGASDTSALVASIGELCLNQWNELCNHQGRLSNLVFYNSSELTILHPTFVIPTKDSYHPAVHGMSSCILASGNFLDARKSSPIVSILKSGSRSNIEDYKAIAKLNVLPNCEYLPQFSDNRTQSEQILLEMIQNK
uniref:Uncharacterized protein n=1 Tax=Glossina austeni TaxID=7395 RepID=A0A1A9VJF1_GLOAU